MQKIYLVPHAHYDAVWAFTKEEYLAIAESTLSRAVELAIKYPEYRFCWEQIFPLKVIDERNAVLGASLRRMIQGGKIYIVDGQYLMPDTMLPDGEVLVREIVFGKKYCKEVFGVDVPVAWCADSFGMNGQLPQIYRKSGYRWVAFRRGTKQMESEFLWRGLDGTTILAHWMPLGYRAGLYLDQLEKSYIELNKYATTLHILMPSGSGSVPPQEETVETVKNWNRDHEGGSEMVIATPAEFFEALEGETKKLEISSGELYDEDLSQVFPQVCSSRMWVKIGARKCEGLLVTAECFATIAWLMGHSYPEDLLAQCWEKMLFIAFHDVIGGCGIDEIYDEVREIFAFLEKELGRVIDDSLAAICSNVDVPNRAVVVFNPLTWRTSNWCEVEVETDSAGEPPGLSLGEEEIETQLLGVIRGENEEVVRVRLGFFADLPPLGYQTYRIIKRTREPDSGIDVGGNTVRNKFFEAMVDPETGILKVFNQKGKPLFEGNELFIENESGDLYYHRYIQTELVKSESGDGLSFGTFKPEGFKITPGPLKTTVSFDEGYYALRWPYRLFEKFGTSIYTHRALGITKQVIVYRDIPRIDFVTRVNNKHPNIRLRVKFDTFKEKMVYIRESQFGTIAEPTEMFTAQDRTGVPAGIPHFMSWFFYGDGTRGISFMNRGIPASEIKGSTVYLTLLRSVGVLSGDGSTGPVIPTPDALELKEYTFEYALQHHDGDWKRAEAYTHGREYHHLPLAVQAQGSGPLPAEFSFLRISPPNLILSALKKADGCGEVILRIFEAVGDETEGEIEFFKNIQKVMVVDLLEREDYELQPHQNKINLTVKPFEIVTLKLWLEKAGSPI